MKNVGANSSTLTHEMLLLIKRPKVNGETSRHEIRVKYFRVAGGFLEFEFSENCMSVPL